MIEGVPQVRGDETNSTNSVEQALLSQQKDIQEPNEEEVIIANILQYVPGWSDAVQASEQLEIKRLNGLSNACFKVALKNDV